MKIAFQLDRQTIKRTDTNTVVAGSKNYLYAKFTAVSGDWIAPITAIFGAYAVVLDEQNECLVPWEVLQNPGSFEVSAFCGDLHTANVEFVKVEATGYKPGETPSEPTPDVYQQLTGMVQEAIDTAQSVRDDADAGKFDGAPGTPGSPGEPGKAATVSVGTVTTGGPDSQAQVDNSGTSTDAVLNFVIPQGKPGAQGPAGASGPANTLEIGTVETLAPGQPATAQITGEAPNQTVSLGIPQGQTGQTGATPALSMGQVETLEPGEPATAELTGTPEAPVLSLGIPQGQPGKDGPANTLSIGQVETLEPGEPATAEISGEAPNQTLSLGIPQGQTGKTGATPALEIGQVETLEPGQPATAEFSGTPEKPVLSLGIPQGQPGKDGTQLEDDAVTSTAAWSSKKIVDALCPAFTAEGNPVACQPAEGYPLGVKVSFLPRKEGEGDPSPENIRPISGWDKVQVTRCGKNLLDFGTKDISKTTKGVTVNYNATTQVITMSGTSESQGSIIVFQIQVTSLSFTSGQKYTITSNTPPDAYTQFTYYTNEGTLKALAFNTTSGAITFVIPDDFRQMNLFQIGVKPSFNLTVPVEVSFQLELGSTPTDYEPYQGDTYDMALPETVYGGTVDCVTGVGSKTWGYIASYNGEPLPGEWISDRDVYASGTTPTTGAQVAYQLATPEPFQATGNQALPAVAGLNTVYTDGDSLEVTGRQDLLYTLQTLQAQTQNLNRFIAEGGTQ